MVFEQLHKVIQSYPELFGLLTFLVGLVIGHWFAIHRDRRKEFNEIADKIVLRWSDQAAEPTPYKVVVTDDATLLRRHFSWWQRKQYEKALAEYENAHDEPNQIELPGGVAGVGAALGETPVGG